MQVAEKLVKTKWGFYEFENIPSEEDLAEFYSKEYYQKQVGLYKRTYSEEELKHMTFVNNLLIAKVNQLCPNCKTVADVGCGEGFLLKEFKNQGFEIMGFDFSSHGISAMNPDLLESFKQGNILEIASQMFDSKKFDVITNTCVMEHVSDAGKLLDVLKLGMQNESILAIRLPNDFSKLHEKLIDEERINKKGWVNYPQHLRYFNKESFINFANDNGLDVVSIVAEYPRDMFLLADEFNYYDHPERGASAYRYNLEHDLFLSEMDIDKVVKLYESYADLGLGRTLTYFCKLKKDN